MESPSGKIILSGVKPSADTLHIGNYLGAIKQWVELQKNNTTYFCVVDLHAITVPYDPKVLHERTLNVAALYIAMGIDPEKSVLFIQSHVPAHSELAWLLGTITPYGELTRMTQFKDLYQIKKQSVSGGLFYYPVLMAADILLYHAHLIPVGHDQKQHIELARNIAEKFNATFGETFALPEPFFNPSTMRVMSLTDPAKKMSKSDQDADSRGAILPVDDPDVIRKKIMGAATETDLPAEGLAKAGAGVRNLFSIYQAFSEESPESIEQKFSGKGYKEFKEALSELLIEKLTPIREKYTELRDDEENLKKILEAGREKAAAVANKTLQDVEKKMGLL